MSEKEELQIPPSLRKNRIMSTKNQESASVSQNYGMWKKMWISGITTAIERVWDVDKGVDNVDNSP